ncbi:MAG: nucleoside triphosphate pyrophosphohydrolase [Deltaproteobacteria bacterium]|nr:nucleoside triphosphate pyrophosphohydrolase [Deltaproteobacteria bacterium]
MTRFAELVDVVARLRGPGGCPWDREQTAESLRACLLEECYETLDAIDRGDSHALREELGDLLLQIVFQAQVAAETGRFTLEDVIGDVVAKMVRRHPHVFGDATVADSGEVMRNWSRIKAAERASRSETADPSVLSGLPPALPALHAAARIGEKAARVGFDWPSPAAALAKVREEVAELEEALASGAPARVEHELGDVLFAVASVARLAEQSPEMALRQALARFGRRFRVIEDAIRCSGRDIHSVTPAELEALWIEAKRAESL